MTTTHDYYDAYLTVGCLRKALKGLPDETPVYYQRIEDAYFKKFGWGKDSIKLEEYDGFTKWTDEFVRAYCVVRTDEPGFFITAHY